MSLGELQDITRERCGHIQVPSWHPPSFEVDQQGLLRPGKPELGLRESLGHMCPKLLPVSPHLDLKP